MPEPPYYGPPPTEPNANPYALPGPPPATPYGPGGPYSAPPSPYGYYPPPYPVIGMGQSYPDADRRPGTLTAAAVLGYVLAGLLILAGLVVLFGASLVHDFSGGAADGTSAELVIAGLVDFAAAGLLIGGSVTMTGRRASGRTLFTVAGAVTVVASFYWIFRWVVEYSNTGGLAVWAVVFAALAVTGLGLAWTAADSRWLAGTTGAGVRVIPR